MKAKALLKEILNTDYTLQYREKLIKEFAEAACKEQRQNCADVIWREELFSIRTKGDLAECVFNALKPNFE